MMALPDGRLIAFYGDDFTGSTDVMEVMTFAGLPTVLFLEPPGPADLAPFVHCRAIGIAGTARSRSPAWMRTHLAPVMRGLHATGAPILQYKICSTFDSSATIGSIGCALEIGLSESGRDWCAMVVGAPALRRYQAFGNLFAAVDGVGYRLDRHPTMARHPVTPMQEADLRRHLAAQTSEAIGLVDLVALKSDLGEAALTALRATGNRAVLFDVLDDETLTKTGRLIWENRGAGVFAVASSGLEYALVAYWREAGLLPPAPRPAARGTSDRLLVVSGSCSPVTAGQIAWAVKTGFVPLRLSTDGISDERRRHAEIGRLTTAAVDAVRQGRDVVVFSADGPLDPAIAHLRETAAEAGMALDDAQREVAIMLAAIAAAVLEQTGLRRLVVAGGDTSGEVAARLGIHALEAVTPLAPGAPLCIAHRRDQSTLEIVLKGGQIGAADFLGIAKRGGV